MNLIKEQVKALVNSQDSLGEVEKITGSVVKEAVTSMKAGKGDVSEGYTSDALMNAPDMMFYYLAILCFYSGIRDLAHKK